MVASAKSALDAQVKAGHLSSDMEKKIESNLSQMITNQVNGTFARPSFGGGPGGGWGGPGGFGRRRQRSAGRIRPARRRALRRRRAPHRRSNVAGREAERRAKRARAASASVEMEVHLVDGTYELFRSFYAQGSRPPRPGGRRGRRGARRRVVDGDDARGGCDARRRRDRPRHRVVPQRSVGRLTRRVRASTPSSSASSRCSRTRSRRSASTVWAMVEQEADDALAAAAAVGAADPRVDQVRRSVHPTRTSGSASAARSCSSTGATAGCSTPTRCARSSASARSRSPTTSRSSATAPTGFRGCKGWGAKSAAAVLAPLRAHRGRSPTTCTNGTSTSRGAPTLAATLTRDRELAMHFKVLATLRADAPVGTVDDWRWAGAGARLDEWCARFGRPELAEARREVALGSRGLMVSSRDGSRSSPVAGAASARAIALGLATDGAAIAVNFRRDEESARATVDEIVAVGRPRSPRTGLDRRLRARRADRRAGAASVSGPIDLLVNNAGVSSRGQNVADTEPAEVDRLWRTHVFGAWALSKLVIPEMREAAARRHRDDLERGNAVHGRLVGAVQHGEGRRSRPSRSRSPRKSASTAST